METKQLEKLEKKVLKVLRAKTPDVGFEVVPYNEWVNPEEMLIRGTIIRKGELLKAVVSLNIEPEENKILESVDDIAHGFFADYQRKVNGLTSFMVDVGTPFKVINGKSKAATIRD